MNRTVAKTYTKYVVKRSIGGRAVQKEEDGMPVLGDVIKTNIRITPAQADTLNDGWDSVEKPISFYYMLDEKAEERAYQKAKEIEAQKQAEKDEMKRQVMEEAKAELLAEMKKDSKADDKEERKALFVEAKELGLEPAKNIKTEALKELILNEKQ